jgi:hypothetical protein
MRPGDLILVRGRGRIHRAIRRLTRSDGEAPTRVTHVAVAVSSTEIVEADYKLGVVRRKFTRGQIHRLRYSAPGDGEKIALYCRASVGQRYGWGKIALHALGLSRLAFVKSTPVCSALAGHAYASAGYYFGKDPNDLTPDDIADFVEAHPVKFERVSPFEPSTLKGVK